MASQKSLILREYAARERLNQSLTAAREHTDIPTPKFNNRNADLRAVEELEFYAEVVESLATGQSAVQDSTPEEQAEQAATFISGTLSIARSSDESALEFLQRVVVKDSDDGTNEDESAGDGEGETDANSEGDEIKPLNPKAESLLLEHIGDAEAIRTATDDELLAINGIGPKSIPHIRQHYPFNG